LPDLSSGYKPNNNSLSMDPEISQLIDDLETKIPEWKNQHKIDGYTVAIIGTSGKLWSQGYGIADHKGTPVTPNTRFMIGSLSKTYTSTAFLRAVQAGLVELDDRLIDYYPEFNWKTGYGGDQREKVTFRHLLTHWAGLQHNGNIRLPSGGFCDFNEYVNRINRMWQKYPVGTRFSYSNLGYDLVATALQNITGQNFEQWMNTQVYDPLGMTRSTTDAWAALQGPDVAWGHFGDSEFTLEDTASPHIASGSQYSSVDDMSRFISMHLNGGIVDGECFLEKHLLEEVYRIPFKDDYQLMAIGMGIGVRRFKYGGELFLSFFGDGPGYLSLHQLFPRLGIGWVMSSNQAINAFPFMNSVATTIEEYLVKAKLGELPPDLDAKDQLPPRKSVSLDPSTLDRLAGRYVSRMTKINVKNENDALLFQYQGKPNKLTPISETEFTSDTTPLIKFNLDESGRPITATLLPKNGYTTVLDYDGGPSDPAGPDKPEWSQYLGYYMYDYGVLCWYYAVQVVNGHLTLANGGDGFRLKEHTPGLFFTSDGQSVDFTQNSMILPDGIYQREKPSAERIKELMNSSPEDLRLHESSLDSLITILERTGNTAEANKIKTIIEEKPQ
jgi:CubicO group peptidase (beta-lactamase class C family)